MQTDDKKNQFDFSEILAIMWRRKWVIVLPLILVTAVTFAGSYLITPMYESSVIIWVGDTVKLSTELQRLLGDARQGYRSQMDRQMELRSLQNEITSTPFLSQLIRNLRLDQNAVLDEEARKLLATSPNLTLEQIKFDLLVSGLRNNIGVSYVGTDQIQITTHSTDPFTSRDMSKTLGEVYIAEKMKQEQGTVRMSQDFTYEQLSKYEKDLKDRVDEKTEFEIEFNKIQLDEQVISDENRRDIQSEINKTRLDIEDRKEEERNLLSRLSGVVNNQTNLNQSSSISNIKRQIKNHLESIASLTLKYHWSAPEILNHKARLFNLIQDLEDENKSQVAKQFAALDENTRERVLTLYNVKDELEILYTRLNTLKLAHDDLNNKVDLIPEYQARLDQLDREVVAARDLRDKFRDQQESSQIKQALLRESKYKIIEPAKIPLAPFKPNRTQVVILGFLLGAAIGGAAALLTELLDKSFRNIEDVEKALGFPVIGVVPQIANVKKLKIKK